MNNHGQKAALLKGKSTDDMLNYLCTEFKKQDAVKMLQDAIPTAKITLVAQDIVLGVHATALFMRTDMEGATLWIGSMRRERGMIHGDVYYWVFHLVNHSASDNGDNPFIGDDEGKNNCDNYYGIPAKDGTLYEECYYCGLQKEQHASWVSAAEHDYMEQQECNDECHAKAKKITVDLTEENRITVTFDSSDSYTDIKVAIECELMDKTKKNWEVLHLNLVHDKRRDDCNVWCIETGATYAGNMRNILGGRKAITLKRTNV